jgi:epoxyqueuosine reductase
LLNYNTAHPLSTESPSQNDQDNPRGWISRYAWGSDYHEVLRGRLNRLVDSLGEYFPSPFEARSYVDTGPVQERVLAKHGGLGWIGKNTLLLNETLGSFFFLGVILTTLDLAPSLGANELPPPDLCGNCRQCLDACPTQAFVEPYVMDARRCISYLTIELRQGIPEEFREPMGRHVFGCDICQDVCPWNRRAPIAALAEFQPGIFPSRDRESNDESLPSEDESLLLPRLEWLAGLSEAEFREMFRDSAIKRTKWRGLVRNACIALGNSDLRLDTVVFARTSALLKRLAGSADPVIAESALWALSRIQ